MLNTVSMNASHAVNVPSVGWIAKGDIISTRRDTPRFTSMRITLDPSVVTAIDDVKVNMLVSERTLFLRLVEIG